MEVSTTTANLEKFLSENSFFLFAYSYFSPSIHGAPLETSCFIKPSAVEEFKRLIKSLEISTENEAVATYWKLKSGLEFFSTIFGTVFILDLTPDKDQYFENKGFKILYPESSKKIIEENGDKIFASRYIKTRLEEYTKEKIEEILGILHLVLIHLLIYHYLTVYGRMGRLIVVRFMYQIGMMVNF